MEHPFGGLMELPVSGWHRMNRSTATQQLAQGRDTMRTSHVTNKASHTVVVTNRERKLAEQAHSGVQTAIL